MKRTIPALPVILALITSLGIAQQTLSVPSQYRTIQLAIDAANNRDTVLVAPGVYNELIDFNGKAIVVRSSGGASVTTIDAGARGSVVSFVTKEARDSILEGFTLSNGKGAPTGGGISCAGSSPTIRDNVITGNTGSKGGGISCTSSSALIEGNMISANSGDGIYCDQGSPVITQNAIADNKGHGITCHTGARPLISRNTISFNKSPTSGGAGILCYSSSAIIVNNMIHGNIGAHGGGINCSDANVVITGNTLTSNSSSGYGGDGIHVHGTITVSITNCIVWETGTTGAIQVWSGNVTVAHCNVAGGYSGTGNINADPQFVDAMNGDLHLKRGSPCINQGLNSAPQMPLDDFDGERRIAELVVDIGADETNTSPLGRLSLLGLPTPGASISLVMLGQPFEPVLLAISFEAVVLNPPVIVPGYGKFFLNWPFVILPLGVVPPSGQVVFPVTFPPTFPVPRDFPVQALIGQTLSNHLVVKVR